MSHLDYKNSFLLLHMLLPPKSLFSIQICHSSQQTNPEGSIWRKEMAGTAAQQRSSRQNHCEIPLHNRHGIASQVEVSAKYFKYRSNRNTQWKLICQLYVLLCFILIVVTNFLTEAAYGRTGLYLRLDSGISFCGVGEGAGTRWW